MNKKCTNCGSKMIEKGEKIISGDTYIILFCEKCHYQCARND